MSRFSAAARLSPAVSALALAFLSPSCGGGNPASPVTPLPSTGPPSPYEVVADFYYGTLTVKVTKSEVFDPCVDPATLAQVGQTYTNEIQVIRAGTVLLILMRDTFGGYGATTDGHNFEIVNKDYFAYACGSSGARVTVSDTVVGNIASEFSGLSGRQISQQKRADGATAAQQEFDWSAEWTYRSTGPYTLQPYPYQPTPPPVFPDF
jgi:hypothetical protein